MAALLAKLFGRKKGSDDGDLPVAAIKSAAPPAVAAIRAHFPGAIHDFVFVSTCAKRLAPLGFAQEVCSTNNVPSGCDILLHILVVVSSHEL